MKNNKNKIYEKIEKLESQVGQNKKNINFDETFDKMEIKKRVLYTLEKQVKQLDGKKVEIEIKNEELKKSL